MYVLIHTLYLLITLNLKKMKTKNNNFRNVIIIILVLAIFLVKPHLPWTYQY